MYAPVQTNQMPTSKKIKNMLWGMVNSTIFRLTPPYLTFFRKFRVILLRSFGAKIDWTASVHPKAKIEYPWNLTLGKMSSIGENSWAYAMAPITIGSLTCIGKDSYLITGSHNINSSTFDLVTKPIEIGNGCWITTGVTILPGCKLGDYCVIAANSTVTKSVEPYDVVGGNPAKFLKKRIIKDA